MSAYGTRFRLRRYLKNSLVISICTMVVCLAVSIFAAYAMSKFRFRGRTFFSTAALFTQLMPGILFILPIYTVFVRIQQTTGIRLVGSYLGIVITYSTFGIPFSIWMMRSYFDTIPSDLAQAAMIDGCTRMQAFFRIILPLSLPGLAATGMYVFTLSWNEVLFATVLTNSETRTFSIGPSGVRRTEHDGSGPDYGGFRGRHRSGRRAVYVFPALYRLGPYRRGRKRMNGTFFPVMIERMNCAFFPVMIE